MRGFEYFLIVSLLIVLFPLLGNGAESEDQLRKETPLNEEVNPVRNSSGASNPAAEQPGIISDGVNIEERWGIQILSIRLSANGYMLDFRYRVIAPEKALPLFSREIKPRLIDQATGATFFVPNPPKVGALRTTRKPEANRNYFILFANPAGYVKKGNKVTVVIGDFKAENLIVE